MLASITPLGERGRGRRWGITVSAYVAGSAAGGALVGALAGAIGSVLLGSASPDARLAVVCASLAIGVAADLAGVTPGPRRQVDERWLDRYRGWVYGAGFGFQIGTGVMTVVVTAAVYVALAAAVATASPLAGAALGLAGGLLRGSIVLATARVHTPAALVRFHARMRRWEARGRLAGLSALSLLLAAALVALAS
jgi:hypothetical protein